MLVVAAVLREGGHDVLLLVLGAAAVVVMAAGLVLRWSGALALGVALLGAQQATRLALGPDALDEATPLVAGALLLAAELAWWSIEPRIPAWAQAGVAVRRVLTVFSTCVAATAALGVLAYVARSP